jgi:hypothetical protein
MKKYLLACMLCCAQAFCFATILHSTSLQDQNFEKQNTTDFSDIFLLKSSENTWKKEYKDEQVLIESTVIVYDDVAAGLKQERVVFKYTNLTSGTLTVSFDRTLYYNGVCYGCDHKDKKYKITLGPLEAKEYSKENQDKTYFIFSKDLNNTITKKLESFQILNIEK